MQLSPLFLANTSGLEYTHTFPWHYTSNSNPISYLLQSTKFPLIFCSLSCYQIWLLFTNKLNVKIFTTSLVYMFDRSIYTVCCWHLASLRNAFTLPSTCSLPFWIINTCTFALWVNSQPSTESSTATCPYNSRLWDIRTLQSKNHVSLHLCLASWLEQLSLKYLLPWSVWYHFLVVPLLPLWTISLISYVDFLHPLKPLSSRDLGIHSRPFSLKASLIAPTHWTISTPSVRSSLPAPNPDVHPPRHFYQGTWYWRRAPFHRHFRDIHTWSAV